MEEHRSDKWVAKPRDALNRVFHRSQLFEYLPLAAQEIRLLTLLPGTKESAIRIFLKAVLFTKDITPTFEALSYAWGSSDNLVDIFITDSTNTSNTAETTGFGTLAITKNLAEALPFLRYADKPRVLWIDAICVNQRDLQERSFQVKRMSDIFSKATGVVVWLGPESDDSPVAMDCVQEVGANVKPDWERLVLNAASLETPRHWTNIYEALPFGRAQFLALYNLTRRPWFERLWIWQEVWLPSPALIIVMCGPRIVPWESLRATIYSLNAKSASSHMVDLFNDGYCHKLFTLCRRNLGNSLENMIEKSKSSICLDPRDRIFALLSIVFSGDQQLGILPDYNKTLCEVYQDVVLRYIDRNRSLNILSAAEIHQEWSEMPSWVPDWSIMRKTTSLRETFASSFASSITHIRQGRSLNTLGISVGVIKHVKTFDLLSMELSIKNGHVIKETILKIASLKAFGQVDQRLGVLCRAVYSNYFSNTFCPPWDQYLTLELSIEVLRNLLSNEIIDENLVFGKEGVFLRDAISFCHGRSLFLTEEGSVGICPQSTKAGDLVTVLLGCDSAMILRPKNANDEFQLVGEANCDIVWDGEALLGPLPPGFAMIQRYEEKRNIWLKTFTNQETGEFQFDDPRLNRVPLPTGWTKRYREPGIGIWYENTETGEEQNYTSDPRMTPEFLRERGVPLRSFDLV